MTVLKCLHNRDRARSFVRMMSHRSFFIIVIITAIGILILLYNSRIGAWSGLDEPCYHHGPHMSHHNNTDRDSPPPPPPPPAGLVVPAKTHADPVCEAFPDTSKVLLVMKTGASEAFTPVPIQMMTVLKCLADYLIFSDMDQNIGGQQIYDSLSTVLYEAQEGNSDFDLYRRQRGYLVD